MTGKPQLVGRRAPADKIPGGARSVVPGFCSLDGARRSEPQVNYGIHSFTLTLMIWGICGEKPALRKQKNPQFEISRFAILYSP
jgi:hypothetical protein